jgi:hypothetical protein
MHTTSCQYDVKRWFQRLQICNAPHYFNNLQCIQRQSSGCEVDIYALSTLLSVLMMYAVMRAMRQCYRSQTLRLYLTVLMLQLITAASAVTPCNTTKSHIYKQSAAP